MGASAASGDVGSHPTLELQLGSPRPGRSAALSVRCSVHRLESDSTGSATHLAARSIYVRAGPGLRTGSRLEHQTCARLDELDRAVVARRNRCQRRGRVVAHLEMREQDARDARPCSQRPDRRAVEVEGVVRHGSGPERDLARAGRPRAGSVAPGRRRVRNRRNRRARSRRSATPGTRDCRPCGSPGRPRAGCRRSRPVRRPTR